MTLNKDQIRSWLQTRHVGPAFQSALHYPELRELTKKDLKSIHQYKRKLPHWELQGSTYFITFRVVKSVGRPFQPVMSQTNVGQAFQSVMSQTNVGQAFQPVNNPASIMEESLWFGFGERYSLDAYVIMPDHVHLLLRPLDGWTLARIMQGIKGFTAREINKILKRKGPLWQQESSDHLIRSEEDWLDKFNYIHQNPVKAGIVENPQDYPFSSLVTIHSYGRLESLPYNNKDH